MRLVSWCVAYLIGDALAVSGTIGWRIAAAAAASPLPRSGSRLRPGWAAASRGGRGRLVRTRRAARRPEPSRPRRSLPLSPQPSNRTTRARSRRSSSARGDRQRDTASSSRSPPRRRRRPGRWRSRSRGWPDFGPGERSPSGRGCARCAARATPAFPIRRWRCAPSASTRSPASRPPAPSAAWPSRRRRSPRRAAYLARRALRAADRSRASSGEAGAFLKTAVLGDRRGVAPRSRTAFAPRARPTSCRCRGCTWRRWRRCFFLAGARPAAARVPGLPLYVDPRAIAAAASLPAIAFFTLLTGEAVATERSALMLALGMTARRWSGGAPSPGRPSPAAALVLLVARRCSSSTSRCSCRWRRSPGIALCARGSAPARGRRGASARGVRCGGSGGSVRRRWPRRSPPRRSCAHVFGEVAPLAPLGNLALVPLVEMVVVPVGPGGRGGRRDLGAARAVAAARWPAARRAWRWRSPRAFRAHAPVWALPRRRTCSRPSLLIAARRAGAVALTGAARPARAPGAVGAALALALVGGRSASSRATSRRRSPTRLAVTFLDVGQGDAAVVEAPGGAVMLIDGGGTRDGPFDTGERIVEPFLRARGIARLDVVALSHPHPDHLNGLFRDPRSASRSARSGRAATTGATPSTARLLALARSRGVADARGRARARSAAPGGRRSGRSLDGDRIAAPPGLTRQRRLARAARRLRGTGRCSSRAISRPTAKGSSSARVRSGRPCAADVLKVPAPRQPDVVERRAARRGRARAGGDLARLAQPVPLPGPRGRGPLRGARRRVLRTDRDGAVTVTVAPAGSPDRPLRARRRATGGRPADDRS